MRTIRATRLLTTLAGIAGIALLTGCSSAGTGNVHGERRDRDRDRDRGYDAPHREDDEPQAREVRGTVAGVDRLNHRIDLSPGETGDDRGGPRRGAFAIYYDYRTSPGREPLKFRPQDLRRGDRVRADVLPTPGGLLVQQLEVLSRGDLEAREPRELRANADDGRVPEPPEARESPEAREPAEPRPGERPAGPLRGIVRYVDTSARTVEIETFPGQERPHRVTVQYDDGTSVESEGRRFSPDNLQLGNRVEIDLRVDGGGQLLLAQRIAVVGRDQPESH
jgi:hypothetical protein